MLIMYNPCNKYLDNKNNLFKKVDSYHLIIYSENSEFNKQTGIHFKRGIYRI